MGIYEKFRRVSKKIPHRKNDEGIYKLEGCLGVS